MKTPKRISALLLSIVMCLSLLPFSAFAADDGEDALQPEKEAAPIEEPADAEEPEAPAAEEGSAEDLEGADFPAALADDPEPDPETETIAIDEEHFPDEEFRAAVSELFDGAEEVSAADFAAVTELDISGKYIGGLVGIEFFTGLEELDCSDNMLDTLYLSDNTALKTLDCSSNAITALDLSENTSLTSVICSGNKILSIADILVPEGCSITANNQAPDALLTALDTGSEYYLFNVTQYWAENALIANAIAKLGGGLYLVPCSRL